MKKLKLNLVNQQGTEILGREQLKKVLGGDNIYGSDIGNCDNNTNCGYMIIYCSSIPVNKLGKCSHNNNECSWSCD